MALRQNIIYIYFKGKHQVTSKSQYQYNRKQYLYFADLNLPQVFEVHFSNRDKGESKTQIGNDKLVEIPDEYFWNGALQIYAWIYLHSGADDSETIYEIRIPLTKRAKPTDEEPLPVQQSAIDRAIAELNNAVNVTTENANKTESDKIIVANIKDEVVDLKEDIDSTAATINQKAQDAIDASGRAETSALNAADSERKALNYSQQAEQSAQEALESKNIAKQKAEIATGASAEALGYRDEAVNARDIAVQAKQNIVDYRDETKGYRDETLNLKNNVQTLKNQIDETAEEIEDISDSVKEDAQSASQSASSANQSSINASESASQAGQFADGAEQSANQAEQSMNMTEDYKNQSETYKNQAETFKNQAEQFKNQSETNVSHYPKIVNDYWYVWDATNGEYINTNVDANGIKGDKGNGIQSAVLNNDYTLTLTFTNGTTYTTPSIRGEKGEQGEPATNMEIHICSITEYNDETRIPTIANPNDKTFYLVPTEDGTSPDLFTEWVYVNNAWEMFGSAKIDLSEYLTDVQINGTSIVSDGVANVPVATMPTSGTDAGNFGLTCFKRGRGISINSADNSIYIDYPSLAQVKAGNDTFKPVTTAHQHESAFYGLAKSAGDTTQSQSSNAVGNYTDEAKDSIQNMLGITPLIASHETDPFESNHVIGELFIINGKLYRAKTALVAGEYVDEGANVEVVNVADVVDEKVSDVQIDGTSVVEGGVVNVPMASKDTLGLVRAGIWGIYQRTEAGVTRLAIDCATSQHIKNGISGWNPISVNKQHESVFYGLTKAAGVDMSTSSNEVGTYTPEAKTAIKQMLGVHDTIDSFVEEVTGTDVTITGQPSYRYNCGELYSLTVTPPESGTIDIRFTSGSTPTVLTLPSTVKMPEWWVEVEANTIYEMCITDGIYCGVMTWAI